MAVAVVVVAVVAVGATAEATEVAMAAAVAVAALVADRQLHIQQPANAGFFFFLGQFQNGSRVCARDDKIKIRGPKACPPRVRWHAPRDRKHVVPSPKTCRPKLKPYTSDPESMSSRA